MEVQIGRVEGCGPSRAEWLPSPYNPFREIRVRDEAESLIRAVHVVGVEAAPSSILQTLKQPLSIAEAGLRLSLLIQA